MVDTGKIMLEPLSYIVEEAEERAGMVACKCYRELASNQRDPTPGM
jgi:hypothetical protein